jgi:hypothetical protein
MKKYFPSIVHFIIGFSTIIPPILGLSFFWIHFPNLTFYLWILSLFFLILFFCGMINLIEGIRIIKNVRDRKQFISSQYLNLLNFFLLIMLIGAFLFYIPYLDSKKLNHGPYLSWSDEDTSTTMTITWVTNTSEPNPIFKWGETSYDVNRIAEVEGNNHHHTVKLRRLKPDHTYYYQIPGFRDIITEFRTGPKIGSHLPFSFLFYGDSREDNPSESEPYHEENIEQMVKIKNTRFVLQAGDIANNYAENWREQWNYNFDVIKPLSKRMPYMTVAGNHDWWEKDKKSKERNVYIDFYELPENGPTKDKLSYYFYYGNAFILVIGYDQQEAASPQKYDESFVDWVREKLLYAKTCGLFDWIFVMHHKPAFSIKIDEGKIEENHTNIRYWHPIFMELGVDFVLNGHNHHYERILMGYTPEEIGTHNITYFISGGGGGGGDLHDTEYATFDSNSDPVGDLLYYGQTKCAIKCYHFVKFSIEGKKIILTVITDRGDEIDTYTLSK